MSIRNRLLLLVINDCTTLLFKSLILVLLRIS